MRKPNKQRATAAENMHLLTFLGFSIHLIGSEPLFCQSRYRMTDAVGNISDKALLRNLSYNNLKQA